jgi:uncharacterized membrane protein
VTGAPDRASHADLDRSIARLLTAGTYGSVALLAIGAVLLFANGLDPLGGAPSFDSSHVLDDVLHLRAAGFMWLGLLVVVATPAARVLAALVAYVRTGQRPMAIIATLILVVIALSVALANSLEA